MRSAGFSGYLCAVQHLAVSSFDDRRRHPRYDVHDLSGVLDGRRMFKILKLSAGGMLIRVPAELALEKRVEVEFPLGEDTFRSEARVVFLGPDLEGATASSEQFRVGLEFTGRPNPDDVLTRYIATHLAPAAAAGTV